MTEQALPRVPMLREPELDEPFAEVVSDLIHCWARLMGAQPEHPAHALPDCGFEAFLRPLFPSFDHEIIVWALQRATDVIASCYEEFGWERALRICSAVLDRYEAPDGRPDRRLA